MAPAQRAIIRLRRPLFGAFCILLLAAVVSLWSNKKLQEARQEKAATYLSKKQKEEQLSQATLDTESLSQRIPKFRQLQESGVIGEEQRQQWTELLQNMQQERKALNMTYQLQVKNRLLSGNSAIPAFASRLRLQTELRHEIDLLMLVTRLERQTKALVILQACQLARQESQPNELRADCEFDLITFHPTTEPQ